MSQSNPQFTCLSCSIAFVSPQDQRLHYHSDHHRYNMKRRVAGLPPVSLTIYTQKLSERTPESGSALAATTDGRSSLSCSVCNKSYSTENAFRSHMNSKKHKENEAKPQPPAPEPSKSTLSSAQEPVPVVKILSTVPDVSDGDSAEISEADIAAAIDAKIAAAPKLTPETDCLFCSTSTTSLDDTLAHMASTHSFFVPDAEYLVDLPGLLRYLGEKLAIGNVCIYCNVRSREFRSLDAVRRHMTDKGHCKIAYDSEDDRLEVSDYYDFTSSYPPDADDSDGSDEGDEDNGEWEDAEDDGDGFAVDEVVDIDASKPKSRKSKKESDPEAIPEQSITYGDSMYELVLPSGSRIGHRAMRRYYAQALPSRARAHADEDPNSGKALVRRLLADRNSALVPRKGGFGAYGSGTDVVKARNRGEAREAGRHVREFRDQRRREDFKTKVGFIHNSQKHYRDPLLQ